MVLFQGGDDDLGVSFDSVDEDLVSAVGGVGSGQFALTCWCQFGLGGDLEFRLL